MPCRSGSVRSSRMTSMPPLISRSSASEKRGTHSIRNGDPPPLPEPPGSFLLRRDLPRQEVLWSEPCSWQSATIIAYAGGLKTMTIQQRFFSRAPLEVGHAVRREAPAPLLQAGNVFANKVGKKALFLAQIAFPAASHRDTTVAPAGDEEIDNLIDEPARNGEY